MTQILTGQGAQAMILDGLTFLMICGFCSAILVASSIDFGNKAIDTYKYLYISEYENSVINTIDVINTGMGESWTRTVGDFMVTGLPDREAFANEEWVGDICKYAPHPMRISITTLEKVKERALTYDCEGLHLSPEVFSTKWYSKNCKGVACKIKVDIYV